jgi:hypothetical protein
MIVRALGGLLFVALIVGAASLGRGSAAAQRATEVDLGPAERFDGFPIYYVGDSFRGVPLTEVHRDRDAGNPVWTFIYGNCEAEGEDSICFPPLQVVNSTVCDEFPAVYCVIPRTRPFRGARAAHTASDAFHVYAGRTSVTFFTDDDRHQGLGAKAIRRVGSNTVATRLPAPPKGSMRGKLPCQERWKRFVDGPHADHLPF